MREQKQIRQIIKNRKAAMLLYLATIALLIAAFAFLTIKVTEKPAKWEPKYIGEHQIALLKTAVNADKLLLFIDQASKPTAMQSIYNLGLKGGFAAGSECGQYMGYEKWRTFSSEENKIKNCIPDEKTIKYDLAYAMNNELYRYLNVYWGKQAAAQLPQTKSASQTPAIQQPAGSNKVTPDAPTTAVSPSTTAGATGKAIMEITGAPIISSEPIAASLPLGVLGKMPTNNYDVSLEQDKDKLNVMGVAKEKAEFDIVLGDIKKKGILAAAAAAGAEKIESGVNAVVDMAGCLIQDPGDGSHSIGHAYSGRLEDAAELPFETDYVYTSPDRQSRHTNYGTRELVIDMQKWGCSIKKTYDVKLFYGDMSDNSGGALGRHKSHKAGRDVDLGLIFKAGDKKIMSIKNGVNDPDFDVEANWLLVKTMFRTSDIYRIFLDTSLKKQLLDWARSHNEDESMIKMANERIKYEPGHNNHYHVRIGCPEGDSQCING